MTQFDEITLRAVLKVQKDKKGMNVSPTHASQLEVFQIFKNAILVSFEVLVKEGKIKEVDVMHGKSYKTL